jgi:hypothetical protein
MKMDGKNEYLKQFLDSIEKWENALNIPEVKHNEDIERILNLDEKHLKLISSKDCLIYSYQLIAYSDYIHTRISKEKSVLDWADSSIWFIIGGVLDQYGDKYTKWQIKYYSAIQENTLAKKILKVKNNAEARYNILEGKQKRAENMSNILKELSRRKNEY